ncbi:MAG: ferrous iron transport protein B, partial [Desulfobacterales bacterium]
IDIVDASNLERNLYLVIQFLEMGLQVCLALNMVDVAKKRRIEIDTKKLSALLGIPVVETVARSGLGKKELMDTACRIVEEGRKQSCLEISYGDDLDRAIAKMTSEIEAEHFLTDTYPARWIALKYLENDKQIISKGHKKNPVCGEKLETIVKKVSSHLEATVNSYPEAMIADHRYGYINSVIKQGVVHLQYDQNRLYTSDKIDKVVTHRFLGPILMIAVLLGLYHFTFTCGEIPVGWLERFFGWIGDTASFFLPDGHLKSLFVAGVVDGVGGVIGFVPLIMFMFLGISILEDSGYLARVAFMLDRVFNMFGLHGSSVMAFVVSGGIAGGCAVPGVMATRTLRSRRERLATLLTVPFMNCGAKLPVFALLIAAFFSENEAVFMLLITIVAWGGALFVAKLLRLTVIRGEPTPFVMELPPYRFPTFKGLLIHTWERTWQYIKKAGTVILGVSIILWAMMTFPRLPESTLSDFAKQRDSIMAASSHSITRTDKPIGKTAVLSELAAIDGAEAEASLKHSIAGRMGIALASLTRWAGFDWRTNIALVGGFAAKEVIVSTLGTAYSLVETDTTNSDSLSQTLANSPKWRPLVALSLMIFIVFYTPCFVAVVCISREAGSWRWGIFSMTFNTVLALILATLVFQIGLALGY